MFDTATVPYESRGTNTGSGIRKVVSLFGPGIKDEGQSRVCIVLTDGNAQDDVLSASAEAADAGVTILAVGIGSGISDAGLLTTAGSTSMVLKISAYSLLSDITSRIREKTAEAPAKLPVSAAAENGISAFVERTLATNQMAFFEASVPNNSSGVNLNLRTVSGSAKGYASWEITNPTDALFDYFIPPHTDVYIPLPTVSRRLSSINGSSINGSRSLHISVVGVENNTTFQMSLTTDTKNNVFVSIAMLSIKGGPTKIMFFLALSFVCLS